MTYRTVLAADDSQAASQLNALAMTSADIVVTDVVTTPTGLMGLVVSADVDVVLLHEQFAQVSAFELARKLSASAPHIGLVLLTHEQSRSLLAAALHAGFRGVAGLPLILPEVESAVLVAGSWAHTVRPKLVSERPVRDDGGHGVGTMLALAGSKGGVGTTTLAVHLSLAAARAERGRSICLVDFDLGAGDLRSMLGLPGRRTVADLVDLPGEPTAVQIDGSLSLHPSGVRVLLAPVPRGARGAGLRRRRTAHPGASAHALRRPDRGRRLDDPAGRGGGDRDGRRGCGGGHSRHTVDALGQPTAGPLGARTHPQGGCVGRAEPRHTRRRRATGSGGQDRRRATAQDRRAGGLRGAGGGGEHRRGGPAQGR
ncbi:MAG: response regulator [Nitriliruptorales bacterium]|nr:response regulator [Nitriliruptorales bacterium]